MLPIDPAFVHRVSVWRRLLRRVPMGLAGAATLALGGCASRPPPVPTPAPPAVVEVPLPPPLPEPPVTVLVPVVDAADEAARHVLAYQARLAQLGPVGLTQEQQRLGDGRESPQAMMELAMVLGSTRASGDLQRAITLLDGLQRDPAASAWQGLARWLAQRYSEQRRAEEQAERLYQQLRDTQRDHQRRIEQLNEKLEALKAIERSLTTRPPPLPASAPRIAP
jgi:hypothetical protein